MAKEGYTCVVIGILTNSSSSFEFYSFIYLYQHYFFSHSVVVLSLQKLQQRKKAKISRVSCARFNRCVSFVFFKHLLHSLNLFCFCFLSQWVLFSFEELKCLCVCVFICVKFQLVRLTYAFPTMRQIIRNISHENVSDLFGEKSKIDQFCAKRVRLMALLLGWHVDECLKIFFKIADFFSVLV